MSENIKVSVTGASASGGTMDGYEFSQDWFKYGPEIWPHLIDMLPKDRSRNFLEIGSFEGRSASWIAENMMRPYDALVCVDTWEGGEEHHSLDMKEVEKRFGRNIDRMRFRFPDMTFTKCKGKSVVALAEDIEVEFKLYDFIYIDGSHQAPDVLTDCVMAWQVLNEGGIMVMDDYLWGDPKIPLHRPKPAIDAFVNIFAENVAVVHIGYQMIIRKQKA